MKENFQKKKFLFPIGKNPGPDLDLLSVSTSDEVFNFPSLNLFTIVGANVPGLPYKSTHTKKRYWKQKNCKKLKKKIAWIVPLSVKLVGVLLPKTLFWTQCHPWDILTPRWETTPLYFYIFTSTLESSEVLFFFWEASNLVPFMIVRILVISFTTVF